MMTPAEEMEQIIKEIAVYDKIDFTKSYTIKSFPEIHIMKFRTCYTVEISKVYQYYGDVNKRFEEFANEVKNRKITIENKILDMGRNILFEGNYSDTLVPIYYEDCVFTSPGVVYIDSNCENCIVEKE